ncbi:MAG: hypothetical protein GX422_04080 [Deltaproteobacteria bacterium]|nr:hypothetical protein [Deltaproteobacteria bacterium]
MVTESTGIRCKSIYTALEPKGIIEVAVNARWGAFTVILRTRCLKIFDTFRRAIDDLEVDLLLSRIIEYRFFAKSLDKVE